MKLNIENILNIKTKKDLDKFNVNKPLFYNNYLFHYLIIFDKMDILELETFPVYKVNEENLNGFMLAAKYDNIKILKYLLKKYPQYAQNHNTDELNFIDFMKNPKKIISLMNEFPNIDWDYLFTFKIGNLYKYQKIIQYLDYDEIKEFIKKIKDYHPFYLLSAIISNNNISESNINKILNDFSIEELNKTDLEYKNNLLLTAFNLEKISVFKYLLEKDVSISTIFYPTTLFLEIFEIIYIDVLKTKISDKIKMLKLFFDKHKKNISHDYRNGSGNNYYYMILNYYDENIDVVKEIQDYILSNSTNKEINNTNENNETNLFSLVRYDFKKYHKYLKDKEVDILTKNTDGKTVIDVANNDWKKFLLSLPTFNNGNIKIKLNKYKYQHQTRFTAMLEDIATYFVYLNEKYKNLFIPKNMDKPNSISKLIWFVGYNIEENTLHFNKNINLEINNARRTNKNDYALLFLSLTLENNSKHANILFYDFKNLTIERFEPYGNQGFDEDFDDILEEELTWNTGFRYLRPSEFLPKPGYQLLSKDFNNKKAGDFGGFCLAWCIWYIEHRLKNTNIEPKQLNNKTLEMLIKDEDTLSEFIRNYSNKLVDYKFKLYKEIGIKEKEISDLTFSNEKWDKLINYFTSYFTYKSIL